MSTLSFTRNAVRVATVLLMITIVAVATGDGFAQSYSGLHEWALQHKLHGWKADSFPLLVDLFILVGELGLFLLALDGYRLRKGFIPITDIMIPAAVASAGWGISLWFNVEHIPNANLEDKVTAGVPPVAAMVGLFIMLRTVHRYMAQLDETAPGTGRHARTVAEPLTEAISPTGYTIPSLEDQSGTALSAAETAGELTAAPEVPDVPELHTTAAQTPEPVHVPEVPEPVQVPEPRTEPVRPAVPVQVPRTETRTEPYGNGPKHPKWNEGVNLYRESLQGPGRPLSQRDLASALGMKNRTLAAAIISHVKEENGDG